MANDLIDRQAAIDALWKALYEYEDKTEKQFIDSEELDVADWIQLRVFVQNMSDIDRQTILGLPSAQPKPISEEYAKAVGCWLMTYQIKCAELLGRYTPYEILGWIVSDWRKENGIW